MMSLDHRAELAVIMPAYNAARTIRAAVDSVLGQSYRDFELWITDDGSTDDTAQIIDGYAKDDSRVKVIHQANAGCYMAKLAALRRISADYFTFIDSDDAFVVGALEKMMTVAVQDNVDIVQCHFCFSHGDGSKEIVRGADNVFQHVIKPLLIRGIGAACTCGKLYRNRFDFGHFAELPITTFEDMAFNLQFFKGAASYARLREPLYDYQINPGSSVSNCREYQFYDFEAIIRFRAKYIPEAWDMSLNDHKWIAQNALSTLSTIASVRIDTLAEKKRKVRLLLAIEKVAEAFRANWILCAFLFLPSGGVVVVIRLLKWARSILRGSR